MAQAQRLNGVAAGDDVQKPVRPSRARLKQGDIAIESLDASLKPLLDLSKSIPDGLTFIPEKPPVRIKKNLIKTVIIASTCVIFGITIVALSLKFALVGFGLILAGGGYSFFKYKTLRREQHTLNNAEKRCGVFLLSDRIFVRFMRTGLSTIIPKADIEKVDSAAEDFSLIKIEVTESAAAAASSSVFDNALMLEGRNYVQTLSPEQDKAGIDVEGAALCTAISTWLDGSDNSNAKASPASTPTKSNRGETAAEAAARQRREREKEEEEEEEGEREREREREREAEAARARAKAAALEEAEEEAEPKPAAPALETEDVALTVEERGGGEVRYDEYGTAYDDLGWWDQDGVKHAWDEEYDYGQHEEGDIQDPHHQDESHR